MERAYVAERIHVPSEIIFFWGGEGSLCFELIFFLLLIAANIKGQSDKK